jgi:hypothetical protein
MGFNRAFEGLMVLKSYDDGPWRTHVPSRDM